MALVRATSPGYVARLFPELKIMSTRPAWMTSTYYDTLRLYDVDAPTGLPRDLIECRRAVGDAHPAERPQ